MATTDKLLIEVAAHLSGRPVIAVRVQEPVWSNMSGACYKTMGFKAIIDLNPGARDVLKSYLHEVAHLKLDWPAMTPSNYWKAEPGSLKIANETRSKLRALPREDEADCWMFFSADNIFDKQLLALMEYPA
jgi:hypothetical protein